MENNNFVDYALLNHYLYGKNIFTWKASNQPFSGIIKNINVLYYVKNGLLHREDGPAVVRPDGRKCYYKNGLLHREDGPAEIHPDGSQQYYKNGLLHRENGPAVIHPDGSKEYWFNDKLIYPNFKICRNCRKLSLM